METLFSLLGLIIPSLIFLAVGVLALKHLPNNPIDFLYGIAAKKQFKSSRFTRWIRILSIAATNLSVLSAIIYLIDGGAKQGYLILLIPIALIVGYYWLRRALDKANKDGSLTSAASGGMLLSINKGASAKTPSSFAKTLTGCWVVVYVLFAFYELVICGKLISPLVGFQASSTGEFVVAGFIFLIGLIYSQIGGMRSVARTDFFQILIGTGAILFLIVWPWVDNSQQTVPSDYFLLPSSVSPFFLLVAVVGAIATQFYNPYNWHSASMIIDPSNTGEQNQKENSIVLNRAAILSAILLAALGITGMEVSSRAYPAPTFGLIDSIANAGNSFAKFIVVAGLFSLTISTLDSLMIALASSLYQSYVRNRSNPSTDEKLDLLQIRIFLLVLYCAGFLALVGFYFLVPPQRVIDVLLTIVSGVAILFPFLLLAMKLYQKGQLILLTNRVVHTFLLLFVLCWVASTAALFTMPTLYDKVPPAFLLIAVIYSYFIYQKSDSPPNVNSQPTGGR
ncbi:MAG: hypothetical protein ACKVRP_00370 [Bacteroidota bacterium]